MHWRDNAACAKAENRDLFVIPEMGTYSHKRSFKARQVCIRQCQARAKCLIFALQMNDEYGILGGLLPSERRKITPKQFEEITGQPWSVALRR